METISFQTKYFDESFSFEMRMITVNEENRVRQKYAGLSDKEKETGLFQTNVEVLRECAANADLAKAIEEFFSQETTVKARIANSAVDFYLTALQPTSSFLLPSKK